MNKIIALSFPMVLSSISLLLVLLLGGFSYLSGSDDITRVKGTKQKLSLDGLLAENQTQPLQRKDEKESNAKENDTYVGKTYTLPRGNYRTSGKVFIQDQKNIVLKEFTIANPPDAFVYLGYGGSASDYVKRGKIISPLLRGKRNDTISLKLKDELKDTPYTHIAVICRQFSFMINRGFKFKDEDKEE